MDVDEPQPTPVHAAMGEADASTKDLPAELLGLIFNRTADIIKNDTKSDAPPCTFLSHVCKRWRIVALACQELWSRYLPRRSAYWTQLCLSRCPDVVLGVAIDSRYKKNDHYREASELVLAQWSRVERFSLEFAVDLDWTNLNNVGQLSTQALAFLQTILDHIAKANNCLRTFHLTINLDGDPSNAWNPMPSRVDEFDTHYPRISEVSFENCLLPIGKPPKAFFNATLRSLRLNDTQAWYNIDDMIRYLQATPMLESFSYELVVDPDDAQFDCRPSQIHGPRSISLPHLTSLNLESFWLHSMAIFNYLSVPPQCHISLCASTDVIELHHDEDEVREEIVAWHITNGVQNLEQHFASAVSKSCFYSEVYLSSHCVSGSRPHALDEATIPAFPQPYFTFPVPSINTDVRFSKSIFDSFASLAIFSAPATLRFETTVWEHYPGRYLSLATVREVHISSDRQAAGFTSALHDKGVALFPGLRRVVLEHVNFKHKATLVRRLVDALCHTHAATNIDRFECLAFQLCPGATVDIMDEIKRQLGANRVEWDHYVDSSFFALLQEQTRQERLEAGEPLVDSDDETFDYDTDWEEH